MNTSLITIADSSSHAAADAGKVAELVASMLADGWQGAPVLAIGEQALTGTHRIEAAREAGIDVPTLDLYDLADDADALVAAVMEATGWGYVEAAAEAMALVMGRGEAERLGDDLDRDPRDIRWALDTDTDADTLAALRA